MNDLSYHLSYLKSLLTPPTTYGWWPHVESRAKELAKDPALTELPALLTAEYERLKEISNVCGPKRPSITNPRSK